MARVALVTGVSRRPGIGFAIAQRLLADGLNVVIHSWSDHDAQTQAGDDAGEMGSVLTELGGLGPRLAHIESDLGDEAAPRRVLKYAVDRFGAIDVLIINHARSGSGSLRELTSESLDLAWAVNARASVLLVQAYAERHDDARRDGRVVLFTSGQHLGPMADELPYAISKGAIHQMTRSLADALAERSITVNAINPGPVDTGWPTPALRERLAPAFPAGRLGAPGDIAPIVTWIVSTDCAWMTGQVIDAEGGFRR